MSLSKSENTIIKGQQEKYVVIKKLKFHGSNVDHGFKGTVFLDKVLERKRMLLDGWSNFCFVQNLLVMIKFCCFQIEFRILNLLQKIDLKLVFYLKRIDL